MVPVDDLVAVEDPLVPVYHPLEPVDNMMMTCSVVISVCVCRRPFRTPKTQPDGCLAVIWLSFWCSNRLHMLVKSARLEYGVICGWPLSIQHARLGQNIFSNDEEPFISWLDSLTENALYRALLNAHSAMNL